MAGGLPTTLWVNDCEYAIDPSFANCMDIILAYEDYQLVDEYKHLVMYKLLYIGENRPPLSDEAIRAGIDFLDGTDGDSPLKTTTAPKKRMFLFSQDMPYIRAAIQKTHGVNLRECPDMHWWKFIDMFMDLDETCVFSRMLQLRSQHSKGKLTKEEKKLWNSMKDILVIRTPEMLAQAAQQDKVAAQLDYLEGLSTAGKEG